MTTQEYYDLLVKTSKDGLFPAQEAKFCKLRTKNGRKCAAGLLIKDEDYMDSLETKSFYEIVNMGLMSIPDNMTVDDIKQCQYLHDSLGLNEWSHTEFVRRLNYITCFGKVKQYTF